MEKSKIKRKEVLIIAFLIIICSAVIFFFQIQSNTGTVAEIYYDGELIREVYLDKEDDQLIALDGEGKVNAEIEDHKIRFVNVNCPDKLCEHVGFLYKDGDIAVCMPNLYHIKIVSN